MIESATGSVMQPVMRPVTRPQRESPARDSSLASATGPANDAAPEPASGVAASPRLVAGGALAAAMALGIACLALALGAARAQTGGALAPTIVAGTARPPTVRIVVKVFPPSRATVSWGRKRLGIIKPKGPLVIERPRDSGPIDLVVRAEGCVPVHTRAYTFTDSLVGVKVTPLDKKSTIYGYRENPPPATDGGAADAPEGPDGGVP